MQCTAYFRENRAGNLVGLVKLWGGMSLKTYKSKRDFAQTAEPEGKPTQSNKKWPIFVIQKHKATRLHFDFRLELGGVLKSWAVPKGPSLNPNDRRLAVHAEDHPFDYRTFEGIIPKGNYGAGTVIVWDQGTYHARDTSGRASHDREIRRQYQKGHLSIVLEGQRVKGEFSLIRMGRSNANQWLLIKKNDDNARTENQFPDTSVVTGRNFQAIEREARVSHQPLDIKAPVLLSDQAKTKSTVIVDDQELTLSNLNKIFWPKEGYTKGDVIQYYRDIAPVILPYLKDRPESLLRHPNGIEGESFFQKNIKQPIPSWIKTKKIHSESREGYIRYLLCQDAPSLIYLANLGCIEINPWFSRIGSLDSPDFIVLDLDPEAVDFSAVVETAQAAHKILDRLGIESFCKTSGKTGLHIFIPMHALYTYDQAVQFAKVLAIAVNKKLPQITSVVRSPAKRQGKVYIDYLQNRRAQTIAAPYSLRPVPHALVSTPLKWSEVTRRLDPTEFNIKTIRKRIDRLGDIWKQVLGPGIDVLSQKAEANG